MLKYQLFKLTKFLKISQLCGKFKPENVASNKYISNF
jgi:hypothetical protein